MAIESKIIQHRRGADKDFDASKMLPGELAVTTDGSRKVYAAFAPGDVKELASKEEVEQAITEGVAAIKEKEQEALNNIGTGLDSSLTEYGKAADAGATGRAIDELKGDLADIFDEVLYTSNLFDNDFDETGYINPSTGEDASSSGYKRTSKYYEITDESAINITIRLYPAISSFVILFYDAEKNFLGYDSANNVTIKQAALPSGAKYFRLYTDISYNSDCYIGTVYVENIVPYKESYVLKDSLVKGENLANSLKNNSNLIETVIDNKYLQNTTGEVFDDDTYRATDFISVDENTSYRLGLFNDANAPTIEIHAITVCFYNSAKSFISEKSVYSSGYTHDNAIWEDGMLTFTTPSGTCYVKVGANDSAYPFKWYLAKAVDSELYTAKDSIKVNADNFNADLQGKVVVHFGDSLVGNTRDYTSTPFYVSEACGATVYNFGFGGCRMSVHESGWDNCSMYRIADDIYNQDFSALVSAINTGWSGMPGYFENTAKWLNACNFSKVDAIVISYGTNDYREPSSVLDNPNEKFDTSTVCGALRYSIKQILSKYPDIQILVTCPVFRTFFADGTTTPSEYSDTKDWGSGTLLDYAEAYKNACVDMNVPFLDLYHETSFNPYTRLNFFPVDDGTHPNEKGRKRMGTLIGNKLKTML